MITGLFDELETGRYPVVTAAYFNTVREDYLSENVVKVVFDKNFNTLYFSRSPIPFTKESDFKGFYQHIGIYGYLKESVAAFIRFPRSGLEERERLEQLRFLQNGIPIKVIETEEKSIGVDVPEDVKKIEEMISKYE